MSQQEEEEPDQAAAQPPYLRRLNPEQHGTATYDFDRPLCIIAGAGTGKTHTMCTRLVHLLRITDTQPWRVLALTYTRNAANEMRARVADYLSEAAEEDEARAALATGRQANEQHADAMGKVPRVQTYHAFCLYLLRRHITALGEGYTSNFSIIFDRKACLDVMIAAIERLELVPRLPQSREHDEELVKRREKQVKDIARTFLIDVLRLKPQHTRASEPTCMPSGLRRAYHEYNTILRERNALDFADMIRLTLDILTRPDNPVLVEVKDRVHRQFRYILVDEFQDTTVVQMQLVEAIVGDNRQITFVGDDDQVIYGWAGARVSHLADFKDFCSAELKILFQNYRCIANILSFAVGVVVQNRNRYSKTLRPTKPDGEPVAVVRCASKADEMEHLISEIEQLMAEGKAYPDIAILCRTNKTLGGVRKALEAAKIPFRLKTGQYLQRRDVVAPLLACLQFLVNPRDPSALTSMAMECLRDLFPARGAGRRRTSDWLDAIVRGAPGAVDLLAHMEERLRVTREIRARARAAAREAEQDDGAQGREDGSEDEHHQEPGQGEEESGAEQMEESENEDEEPSEDEDMPSSVPSSSSSSSASSPSAVQPFDDDETERGVRQILRFVRQLKTVAEGGSLQGLVAFACDRIPKLGGKVSASEEGDSSSSDSSSDGDSDSDGSDSHDEAEEDGAAAAPSQGRGEATPSTPLTASSQQSRPRTPASSSSRAGATPSTRRARKSKNKVKLLADVLAQEAQLFDRGTLPYDQDAHLVVVEDDDDDGETQARGNDAPWVARARLYIDQVSAIVEEGLGFECEGLTPESDIFYFVKSKRARKGGQTLNPEVPNAVWLSTVYQAKGLEWPAVLVPRFNEGSFPCIFNGGGNRPVGNGGGNGGGNGADDENNGLDEDGAARSGELEEETRVAHVALSRAKDRLVISYIADPFNPPSCFLEDLPTASFELRAQRPRATAASAGGSSSGGGGGGGGDDDDGHGGGGGSGGAGGLRMTPSQTPETPARENDNGGSARGRLQRSRRHPIHTRLSSSLPVLREADEEEEGGGEGVGTGMRLEGDMEGAAAATQQQEGEEEEAEAMRSDDSARLDEATGASAAAASSASASASQPQRRRRRAASSSSSSSSSDASCGGGGGVAAAAAPAAAVSASTPAAKKSKTKKEKEEEAAKSSHKITEFFRRETR